jgi:hypothetical protein
MAASSVLLLLLCCEVGRHPAEGRKDSLFIQSSRKRLGVV